MFAGQPILEIDHALAVEGALVVEGHIALGGGSLHVEGELTTLAGDCERALGGFEVDNLSAEVYHRDFDLGGVEGGLGERVGALSELHRRGDLDSSVVVAGIHEIGIGLIVGEHASQFGGGSGAAYGDGGYACGQVGLIDGAVVIDGDGVALFESAKEDLIAVVDAADLQGAVVGVVLGCAGPVLVDTEEGGMGSGVLAVLAVEDGEEHVFAIREGDIEGGGGALGLAHGKDSHGVVATNNVTYSGMGVVVLGLLVTTRGETKGGYKQGCP